MSQSHRTVENPTCGQCGEDMNGVAINVDDWNTIVCEDCYTEEWHKSLPKSVIPIIGQRRDD